MYRFEREIEEFRLKKPLACFRCGCMVYLPYIYPVKINDDLFIDVNLCYWCLEASNYDYEDKIIEKIRFLLRLDEGYYNGLLVFDGDE